MSETNIEWLLNQNEINSLELKDLEELLNKIDSLDNFDFSKLDTDDLNLSETEMKLKQRLEEIEWKKEFIEELLKQIKLLNWKEKNENFSLNNSCRIDDPIEQSENIKFYLNNPEYIIKITYIPLLNKVIESYDWEINLDQINKNLYNDFLLNPKINITFDSLIYIDKNLLENHMEEMCKKTWDFSRFILLKAISFWIDKERIKNIIKNNNLIINDAFQDINRYIWNTEKIDKKSFDILKEKYNNFDDLENKEILNEDLKIITNYLIENQKEPENIKIISKLINNKILWNENAFLFMANPHKDISISIIKLSPSYILYTPNNILSDPDVINAFLNEPWKNKDHNIDDKIKWLKYLNLSDINNFLNVMDFFLEKWKILEEIYLEYPNLIDYIEENLINPETNKINIINKKNRKTAEYIKKIYNWENLSYKKTEIVDAKQSNNDLKWKLWKETINQFKEWLNKKLEWKLNAKEIKNIISIIENINEIDDNIIKKLTLNIIWIKWLDSKKKEEIFWIIINHFKDFKKQEIKKLASEMDLTKVSKDFIKMVDWKEELNRELISSKFNEFTEIKKEELKLLKWEEREQKINDLKNEFIKKYFKNSSIEDQNKILEILNLYKEINNFDTIWNNISAYFDYVKSWSNLSFEDYAEENKVTLNNINNQYITENNNIIENKNYTYNSETWELDINTPNWKQKLNLTPEEAMLAQDEKYRENLVNFYSFFKDLNLIWVWNFRHDLVNAIWNVNIDLTDDSLSKSELLNFWNKLINFINNTWDVKLNNNNNSVNSLNSELLKYTNAWSSLSDNKTYNLKWEDRFTSKLRELWIIWGAYFHVNNFRNLLNNKKES